MINWFRRFASLPGLRRVLLRPGVRRALAKVLMLRFLIVARRVTTPIRFLVRELTRSSGEFEYRLRGTARTITLKHGRDLEAFYEIFDGGEYEPPAELVGRLAGATRLLDVGANVGMFSSWALDRWKDCRITAFEPAPESSSLMRRWAANYGDRLELVEAAAATRAGELFFIQGLGAGNQAVAAPGPGTINVPAVDIFDWMHDIDLMKLDIEGGEWPILADPRLAEAGVDVLVMEYHRSGAPTLPAAEAASRLLEAAGFTVVAVHANYWGHGVLWAVRDKAPVSGSGV